MPPKYQGTIIEESLIDNRIMNDLEIINFRISQDEDPAKRWHLYNVVVTREEIDHLADNIKAKWYMHFWHGREVIAVFQGRKFEFDYNDKSTWTPAVSYGLSLGIPAEQLDFVID